MSVVLAGRPRRTADGRSEEDRGDARKAHRIRLHGARCRRRWSSGAGARLVLEQHALALPSTLAFAGELRGPHGMWGLLSPARKRLGWDTAIRALPGRVQRYPTLTHMPGPVSQH